MSAQSEQDQPTLVSPNLVKVMTSKWRAKIWAELRLRPMSPSQFVREVGGERSHIARLFRELAAWDLIELVETRSGGHRRGGVEHFYRTVRPAQIDDESASRLPLPMREEISANVLGSYIQRLGEAVEGGTFGAEPERHVSCEVGILDRQGWKELTGELGRTIDWMPSVVAAAAQRMASSGEESIPTTMGMTAFRSPLSTGVDEPPGALPPPAGGKEAVWDNELREAAPFLSTAVAKAVANPWRTRVLAEVSLRPMSPSQFVREVGGELDQIARCFRHLAARGFLELAEKRPASGRGPVAVEHIYRIARRVTPPTDAWDQVPGLVKDEVAATVLSDCFARIATAFEAGTFDLEPDRHLSWDVVALDRQALAALTSRLDEIRSWVPVLARETEERDAPPEERILVTVALGAFRSPPAAAAAN